MADRTYWLDLFTGKTWDEFKAAGGTVSGFRKSRWKSVQRMKPGDYLLCYITGVSRFVAVLEVTGKGFKGTTPIWADDDFPCRVNVATVVEVAPEHAVPIQTMREQPGTEAGKVAADCDRTVSSRDVRAEDSTWFDRRAWTHRAGYTTYSIERRDGRSCSPTVATTATS